MDHYDHPQHGRQWPGIALLVLGVAVSATAWYLTTSKRNGDDMYRAKWTDAVGMEHEVTTEIGEDPVASAQVHAARIAALQAIYPPG